MILLCPQTIQFLEVELVNLSNENDALKNKRSLKRFPERCTYLFVLSFLCEKDHKESYSARKI